MHQKFSQPSCWHVDSCHLLRQIRLLTPCADHLFDRGFISFDDDGELLVWGVADVRSLKRMGADPDSPPSPLAFNRDQRHFLEFHRREVFLGAGS